MILIFVVREDVGTLSALLNVHVIQDLKSGWMENAKVCRSWNGPPSQTEYVCHLRLLNITLLSYME